MPTTALKPRICDKVIQLLAFIVQAKVKAVQEAAAVAHAKDQRHCGEAKEIVGDRWEEAATKEWRSGSDSDLVRHCGEAKEIVGDRWEEAATKEWRSGSDSDLVDTYGGDLKSGSGTTAFDN
nr:hypothetical protein [Tanacetum cinerariifolium]